MEGGEVSVTMSSDTCVAELIETPLASQSELAQ